MGRVFGVTAIVVSTLALVVDTASAIPPSSAGPPGPNLSTVPTFITIAPDGGGPGDFVSIPIQVSTWLGGVAGAIVEIEFSQEATGLIGWSDPVPAGADVPIQTCPARKYVKAADETGLAVFHIAGGGCLVEPAFVGGAFIAEIRADQIVLAQREVNSPDAVNGAGDLPTDGTPSPGAVCDEGAMSISLADAVFHSPSFKTGNYNKCSDLTAPYGGTIELGDATVGTVYIKAGSGASCFAGCP